MADSTRKRWIFDGLYIYGNTIVGTAAKAPNGYYYARGCEDEWEDVSLGCFDTEKDARKAVEQWVRENE